MNKEIAAALQHATTLTRAGRLGEAASLLRSALNRSDLSSTLGTTVAQGAEATTARSTTTQCIAGPAEQGPARPRPKPSRSGLVTRPLADTICNLVAGRDLLAKLQDGLHRATVSPAVPEGARYLLRDYAGPAGERSYRIYIPASARDGVRGLVMMLHGCKQNPDDFAAGTAMNARAEAERLLVVYPAQTTGANPSACWNWFAPTDQTRGSGEPAILAGLARSVADEFALPRDQVFVAGLSAGGAMAAILGETYPDVFSAVGIHSGLPVGAAHDIASAFAAMSGRGARSGAHSAQATDARLIVFHGTGDTVVHPSNAEAIVAPHRRLATSVDRRNGRTQDGRHFERVAYLGPDGVPLVEHWSLEGMGHAWSGGNPAGSYTDASGPDASAEMVRFFLQGRTSPK